ncbi:hypothetical protein Tco_1064186, partial [Tanacetum coccineum]
LGWLLEEIHVTWAQLEKKRTRPRLYTNYLEENLTDRGDGVANHTRRRHITQETASWISRRRQNFDSKSSSLGERDHDVIHKVVEVRGSIRMSGTDMLIEASEKHSIGKCHNIALGHTLNPFGDVVC